MFLRWLLILLLFARIPFAVCQNLDIRLLREANVHRNTHLDGVFLATSRTATPIAFAGAAVTAGVLYYADRKDMAYLHIAAPVANAFITYGLKELINKPRPFVTYPDIQKLDAGGSPSFPSGHTSAAFTFATALSISYPKWYVIAPAYTWATAVGYSRMHLGVHYPSDVLAGAAVGTLCTFLSYRAVQYLHKTKSDRQKKVQLSLNGL
jgi:membrane-associated phospholipid phosphatase